jgi:hypothetical protein
MAQIKKQEKDEVLRWAKTKGDRDYRSFPAF